LSELGKKQKGILFMKHHVVIIRAVKLMHKCVNKLMCIKKINAR